MRYYKRRWEEARGDRHDGWGHSHWYFEVDGGGNVVRQIEVYDNGPVLRYSETDPEDEYGGLAVEFSCDEMAPYAIDEAEFKSRWDEDS